MKCGNYVIKIKNYRLSKQKLLFENLNLKKKRKKYSNIYNYLVN